MAKYILFDTETTGTEIEDRIIQVGAMIVHSKDNIEIFDELCSTDIEIKLQAMEIHNITPNKLLDKPKYQDTSFAQKLNEFNSEDNYLIAHNINFDLKMIEKEGFVNQYQLIDTLRCSKHLLDMPFFRLQYLRYALKLYEDEEIECKKHNLEIKAHDAIGDVLVMKLLLSKLVQKCMTNYPNKNPMVELARLTKTPVLIKKFAFGKHKDKDISSVVKSDSGYVTWMKKNMDLDEDMIYSLNFYENN